MERLAVVDVALDPRNGGSEAVWTYRNLQGLRVGDAVVVPLGSRSSLGFVTEVYEATEEELGFRFSQLKAPQGRVEGLTLPETTIELARFVANEYLCPLPVALSAATPPGVRDRLQTVWVETGVPRPSSGLSPIQDEALRVIQESGGGYVESRTSPLAAGVVRALKRLATLGLVERRLQVMPKSERRKSETLLRLSADEGQIDRFLAKEGKKKPAQALTLMRLQTAEHGALTPEEIRALAGVTDATIRALRDSKLLVSADEDAMVVRRTPPTPNPAQKLAIEAITASIQEKSSDGFLLFGVTGSGKTEVYLRAAAEALRMGRQVLYLVPEIALAAQAIAQLRDRFGTTVAVLHSDLPKAQRLTNWLRARDGEASVVIGARSALFAPLRNVGLIVIDEEHEQTYKQESAPRYHARAVAMQLAALHHCPIVLGSATPSIESLYATDEGTLNLIALPERTASARLPEVRIRDLGEGYRAGAPAILTPELRHEVELSLGRGEQAILFLNRRAYSPSLLCRDCGKGVQCPHCSVSLSYHRRDNVLRCHHCGYQSRPPEKCAFCGSPKLAPLGIGTEKVEEAVGSAFPGAVVARLDRDVARKSGALEDILARFRAGEIQILVGTQMVAKGLDFPNVTAVGVIAADVSLNLPDFRASERTFQLLSQVSGRAGRGRAPGVVVLQTFNPTHPAVTFAQRHDFGSFYAEQIKEREAAGYPPFRRLVNIVLSGEDARAVREASDEVRERLRPLEDRSTIMGPVDCAVERALGRWRRHLLIKLPAKASAGPVGEALLGFVPKGVQIVIDVDPYSLL